ncbi:MAG: excisionase family DNA-binding protein [Acidimicrobiales bacterium]
MNAATTTHTPDDFLPVATSAKVLSISLRTMETLIANGDIPVARISRRVRRIRRADLDAYIERVTTRHHNGVATQSDSTSR